LLFLFAIVLGLVFGLLTGGRIGNLSRVRFRWPWVVLAAVLVREVVLLTPLNSVNGAAYLYVAALAAILAWTVFHWKRLPGVWLVSAGTALNLLVIVVNGARMPVAPEFAASLVRHGSVGQYTVMGSGTHLNLLADWISLHPVPEVYSPGDVLIAIGLAITVFIVTATPMRIVN
jgi:uncharacterized membrane protein YeiH